ncbi:MAG TPA: ASCH domain-containing protein [Patescibacteria group bacterium]|nr:ASCH domain-containing protein [Patescibacteria group bacterium]
MATFKRPLLALLISPDQGERRAILEGRLKISVREGYRDGYDPGRPVMICCHLDPWCVMATITASRHCLLSEVTEEERSDHGFASREDLLAGIRRFYPAMGWDSAVTVIRWDSVCGKLVENWAEFRKSSSWVLQDSPPESSF